MNKRDAARRQLLAAIHLHWYFDEPIAAYTLASNAWELIDALLQLNRDDLRTLAQIEKVHGPSLPFRQIVNRPRNFVKHADRDPLAEAPEIEASDCDAIISMAALDYMVLGKSSPYLFGMFMAWYAAVYPVKTGDFFKDTADQLFPNLEHKPRHEQIAAAKKAAREWGASKIMTSTKNELTDNHRWTRLRESELA